MLIADLWKTEAGSLGGLFERGAIIAVFVEITREAQLNDPGGCCSCSAHCERCCLCSVSCIWKTDCRRCTWRVKCFQSISGDTRVCTWKSWVWCWGIALWCSLASILTILQQIFLTSGWEFKLIEVWHMHKAHHNIAPLRSGAMTATSCVLLCLLCNPQIKHLLCLWITALSWSEDALAPNCLPWGFPDYQILT